MPRHAPRPDPFYAIRTRRGAWGTVYRVSFTRHGKNVAKLFRARDFDNARSALKAARAWRDNMNQSVLPETKQEFSQHLPARPVPEQRPAILQVQNGYRLQSCLPMSNWH